MVQKLKISYNKWINDIIVLKDSSSEQTIPLVNAYQTNELKIEFESV